MSRRSLLVITGSRADFGLWSPVLAEAKRRSTAVEVRLLATGMHLDPRFGSTIDEVRASGVPIAAEIPFTSQDDGAAAMAASLGMALTGMAPAIAELAPDWVCVLGDRGEQLAAAVVSLHLGLPVAHVHGGERSLGVVDDAVRDMVSRIAHLHLVANAAAGERLERMGEAPWRIRVVGAPGLDDMEDCEPAAPELRRGYGLPPDGSYLVVSQHPETVGGRDSADDMRATLRAVARSGLPALAIGPNADAGGRAALAAIHSTRDPGLVVHASVPRGDYLRLLAGAAALIGNSSSGIIEAPFLSVPAVNIGDRQRARTRGDNVIDVAHDTDAIVDGIRRALDPEFRARLSGTSPYGDGQAAPRILDAILSQAIDARLLVKEVAP